QSPRSMHTTCAPFSARRLVTAAPAAPEPITSTSALSLVSFTAPPGRGASCFEQERGAYPGPQPSLGTLGKRGHLAPWGGCNTLHRHSRRRPQSWVHDPFQGLRAAEHVVHALSPKIPFQTEQSPPVASHPGTPQSLRGCSDTASRSTASIPVLRPP